ncbi:hypothetical protein C5167_043884 [Papaver somniferum]|uniref:Uncharacterized protein n=1 Tax=Papaver somniferum TaxID=3469 RepID=A0A4Y7L9F7_PAPSO|nr:hypothetical protein C5167_043884 [Papaver somniferum]
MGLISSALLLPGREGFRRPAKSCRYDSLCTRPCSKNGEFHLIYQLISFGTFHEVLKPVFFALCSNLGSILCATPLFQQISFAHVLVDAPRIRIGFLLTIHFVVEIFVSFSLTRNILDEMGSRIDGLEKDINEFRADMELDRSKPKRQDIKPEDAST